MNPAKVMFVLTLYKDHERALEMLRTLATSGLPGVRTVESPSAEWLGRTLLMVQDATVGSIGDVAIKSMHLLCKGGADYSYDKYDNRPGLPEVMNDAIKEAIRQDLDYVAWIHPDMDFTFDPLWLARCIMWLEDEPTCGKVSPLEAKSQDEIGQGVVGLKPFTGNACPWVMRVSDLKTLWDSEGWVFDPAYKLMHYEDWDLINRINLELGMVAHIIPWATVIHEGMGTRKSYDYEDSLDVNRRYFEQKWGMTRHL